MITVHLHGSLKTFGSRFVLYADSPADALNGLFSQIQGLRQKVRDGYFLVRFNGVVQSETDVLNTFRLPAQGDLHLVPRTAGAGRVGQIVAGVVIAVVGAYFGQAWAVQLGVGLALGGAAQLLAKQPNLDMESRSRKSSRNTAFSNLDNTAAQGQPVPLAYGVVYCGSRVISQGVQSRRVETSGDVVLNNPTATDITLQISKTYTGGVAAIAPNGQPYQTDFANESVRARNYTAALVQG
ncbi:tail assembly protein [Wielerella bovis]|uniref:tail assembly protein n=1 Tax=Wielerella bovis TaxID=2917790 RepID=UPI002019A838|nr:tail assembly protein [Wielerella bovis]ULJ59734.1 tail assembly protein [Wielerella bovis]